MRQQRCYKRRMCKDLGLSHHHPGPKATQDGKSERQPLILNSHPEVSGPLEREFLRRKRTRAGMDILSGSVCPSKGRMSGALPKQRMLTKVLSHSVRGDSHSLSAHKCHRQSHIPLLLAKQMCISKTGLRAGHWVPLGVVREELVRVFGSKSGHCVL